MSCGAHHPKRKAHKAKRRGGPRLNKIRPIVKGGWPRKARKTRKTRTPRVRNPRLTSIKPILKGGGHVGGRSHSRKLHCHNAKRRSAPKTHRRGHGTRRPPVRKKVVRPVMATQARAQRQRRR